MYGLKKDREIMEALMPGLDACLQELSLEELERPGNPGIQLFRSFRGPSLLLPEALNGLGAQALQAIHIHRALGSRAPSLAIAATMHNFTVATLVGYRDVSDYGDELLSAIGQDCLLLASGFAEGKAGGSILSPMMVARRTADGYVVTGNKKPCSLSVSMDLLAASVLVQDQIENIERRAVALIPANLPGIERRPFWRAGVLSGAESDEIILTDVVVPEELVFFPESDDGLDEVSTAGFIWFQMLVSASYLGIACGLIERVVELNKGTPTERALLGAEAEGAMSALEGIAFATMMHFQAEALLARALFIRIAVQRAIERIAMHAAELLGGMAYIVSSDVQYLLSCCRALAFHPPSRLSISPSLADYMDGQPIRMV